MSTMRLLERRKALTDKMKSLSKPYDDAGTAMPEAEQRQFDELRAGLEPLDASIDRQALYDAADLRAIGTPLDGTGDAGFDKLASQVSILDVIRAQMPGTTDAGAGRAREVSKELERRSGRTPQGLLYSMNRPARQEQRVFSTTTPAGGPGSVLIQTDVSPNMIDILRAKTIVRALGATVLGGLVGNLSIPRLKASATAYWVAENQALTVSDPQTEAVPLAPKTIGGEVEYTRNMGLQTGSPGVEAMIENDLMQIIARGLDRVALVGGGTNEPKGLLSAGSGITILPLAAVGGPPTWDMAINLIAAVDVANALSGTLAFATNGKAVAKMRRTLRNTADTASTFIQEGAATLAGYPLASSSLVPSDGTKSTGTALSSLIFGDWSQLVIGFWSEIDILVNPYSEPAYSKGNILVRAMSTADVAIKQPLAFSAVTDMITT